jgi:hypothetical protein
MAHIELSASLKGAAKFALAIIEKAVFAKTMFAWADNMATRAWGQANQWNKKFGRSGETEEMVSSAVAG